VTHDVSVLTGQLAHRRPTCPHRIRIGEALAAADAVIDPIVVEPEYAAASVAAESAASGRPCPETAEQVDQVEREV
jgi:hypothetical protein